MKALAILGVGVLGFAGMCHAGQIASPALYASFAQQVALCIIYNGGSTAQTVSAQLFDETGAPLTGVHTSCGGPLAAGEFCSIAKIGISNDSAYACSATAASVAHLRGSIILQDGSDTSLRSAPLR